MKLKRYYITMMMAGMVGFAGTAAQAEEGGVSVGGDIGVASQYVWRGAVQKGTTSVQGDVSVAYDGLSVSGWFSNSYASPVARTAGKEVTEFDFTGDYSGSVGDFGYSVGGIYYTYMYDSGSNFGEAYAGISYDAVVSPSLTAYYTVKGTTSGFYKTGDVWVDLGLSTSAAGFDFSATASYVKWKKDAVNRAVVGTLNTYKNGISLVQLGVSKDVEVAGLTVTPSLTAIVPVIGKSSDGNRYIYGTQVFNEFVAAVNIAY
ncbi:hypothetical protein [Mariprofundus ferrooxydans]|uniref:hypothetical protein n=1 Tax=Mariprofundus ferrooxydans TaxID=314344 RepID=UPI001F0F04FD|nr:hypothetical protein [Mariprofundus ferrooxydans]